MRSDWTQFTWIVPEGGYKWETLAADPPRADWEDDTHTMLVRCKELPASWTQYQPLRISNSIFRNFAELDPNNLAELLEFANRYGTLGLEGRNYRSFRPSPPAEAESHGYWYEEILSMRDAIRTWDAALANDSPFADRVHWGDDGVVVVTSDAPGDLQRVVFSAAEMPELFRLLKPGDTSRPLQFFVQQRINGKLAEYDVVAKMLWDRALKELDLWLTPSNLIGALWAQFAESISRKRVFGSCESCGNWFQVTTEKRVDTKFCSNACRSRAYRRRKRH